MSLPKCSGYAIQNNIHCLYHFLINYVEFVYIAIYSNPQHPYLKQWSKECSHYNKDDIMSYSMVQLLPVAQQPDEGQEVTQQQEMTGQAVAEQDTIMKEEVESGKGNGGDEGIVNTAETHPGSLVEEGEEEIACKRKLRTSTLVQKQAMYVSPRRTRRCKECPSGDDATELERDDDAIREVSSSSSPPPLPLSSAATVEEESNVKPLLSLSQASLPSITSHVTDNSSGPSSTLQATNTNMMSTGPIVIVSAASSDVQQNSIKLTEPKEVEPGEEELMEIISQDEFGVSEVPVFAMEADRQPRLPARYLPPLSVMATPTGAARLPNTDCGSSGSNGVAISTTSFSPSVQSAFKPVVAASTKPSPHKIISTSAGINTNALGPNLSLNSAPTVTTVAEASLPPSLPRIEPVTLGEFSEAFLQGDTTNWFRRMKLLDHIEAVQDNVQAWLDLIGKKLTGE